MSSEEISKLTNIEECILENSIRSGTLFGIPNPQISENKDLEMWRFASCIIRPLRNVCHFSEYVLKCQNWVTLELDL